MKAKIREKKEEKKKSRSFCYLTHFLMNAVTPMKAKRREKKEKKRKDHFVT